MTKETNIMRLITLEASKSNNRLFRNNVGTFQTLDGRYIQTGLCVGSADLIGWTTKIITADMVGQSIAVFTAVETKKANFKNPKNLDNRLKLQINFIKKVKESGGIAAIISSEQQYKDLIK